MSRSADSLLVAVLSRAHVHADGYIELLAETAGVDLMVCDPDGPPAADRGPRGLPAGARYVDGYREVFAQRPDAVVIMSETSRHRELIEPAAESGAAILCEKPLATTAADARAIADVVGRRGVPFMIAHPVRFMAACSELIGRARAGQLGELVAVRGTNNGKLPAERSWFVEPEWSGGGALFDHVVHVADLIDALTDARAASVSAITNRILYADRVGATGADVLGTGGPETGGLVLINYAGGPVAAIDCSWSRPASAPSWGGLTINVTGTAGEVFVDAFRPRVRGIEAGNGRALELPYGLGGDASLIDAFLDLVRAGQPARPDLGTALRTLAIVLAAAESAARGRSVDVPELAW